MSSSKKFSSIGMAILEFLNSDPSPKSAVEIASALRPEWQEKSKYLYSSLTRLDAIQQKGKAINGRPAFTITAAGRKIVKDKDSYELTDIVNSSNLPQHKHPETGELLSAYKFNKLKDERPDLFPGETRRYNRKPKIDQPPATQALPNVSLTANALMDNISEVIHQNAAYREAMLKVCNTIAGLLDMKVVPRNQE